MTIEGRSPIAGQRAALASVARVLWLPVALFVLHLWLCGPIDGYGRFALTDELMHLAGGFAIALAVAGALAELCARAIAPDPGPLLRALLVFGLAAAAAVLWELGEFVSDRTFGTRTLGDLEDTLAYELLWLAPIAAS